MKVLMLSPVHHPKLLQWPSELGAMGGGGLVFNIMWTSRGVGVRESVYNLQYLKQTWDQDGKKLAGGSSVMLWTVFCWDTWVLSFSVMLWTVFRVLQCSCGCYSDSSYLL